MALKCLLFGQQPRGFIKFGVTSVELIIFQILIVLEEVIEPLALRSGGGVHRASGSPPYPAFKVALPIEAMLAGFEIWRASATGRHCCQTRGSGSKPICKIGRAHV